MKNRDIYWRYKIQETLHIGQLCLSPIQSRHLGTSHSSRSVSSTVQNTLQNPLLELPSAALSYFPESHWWSEISSFSKLILVLGKARSCKAPNLGCRGTESPGWFDVSPKSSRSCIQISRSASSSHTVKSAILLIASRTRSTFSGVLLVAGPPECGSISTDSQPSLKHLCHTFICAALIVSFPKAFWIIWMVSVVELSSLMQNFMRIHCSTHSVILNVTATQHTCSINGVYHPHWLVQWSRCCSHMCISVHLPWLPGFINVTQTLLSTLIMAFYWQTIVLWDPDFVFFRYIPRSGLLW